MNGRVTLGATYFNNTFKDEIYTTYPAPLFIASPANRTTSSKQKGLEVYVQAKLSGGFRVDGNYTYLDAKQPRSVLINNVFTNFVGQAVRRPKGIASLNFSYEPDNAPFAATLTVRHTGRQNELDFTDPSFTPVLVKEKSFTLVNFNTSYKISKTIELFGRVENLLNTKYEEVFSFATPGAAVYGGVRVRL